MTSNNQALEKILRIQTIEKEKLIKRAEWGSINFSEIQESILSIFQIVSKLEKLDLNLIPNAKLEQLIKALDQTYQILTSINGYNIAQENHIYAKNALSKDLNQTAEFLFNISGPIISILSNNDESAGELANDYLKNFEETKLKYDETLDKILSKENEIEQIIEASKQAASKTISTEFSNEFLTESENNKESAQKWLIATIGFSTIALALAVLFVFVLPITDKQSYLVFQKLAGRFFILGIFVSAALWCSKIYKSLLHLKTVYNHKEISIRTLLAFKETATDDATKDLVVIEAAKSVYGSIPTGFLNSSDAKNDSSLQFFEIVKHLKPSTK